MKTENAIRDKSYRFALRIVRLYLYLKQMRHETHLSGQLVRSGTSIGANIEEAMGGSSRRDFRAKLAIAYREARETLFWIKLLRDSAIIDPKLAASFIQDCEELLKLLTSILNTLKDR